MPNNGFSFDDINPFATPNPTPNAEPEEEEQINFLFFGGAKKEPESPAFPPTFGQIPQSPPRAKPATPAQNPFIQQPASQQSFFQQPTQQPVAQKPIFKDPEPAASAPAQTPIFAPASQPEEKPDILDRYDPVKVKQVDETLAKMINDGAIADIPTLKEAFNRLKLPYEAILSKKLSNTGDAALNSDGICDSANAILIGGQELSL